MKAKSEVNPMVEAMITNKINKSRRRKWFVVIICGIVSCLLLLIAAFSNFGTEIRVILAVIGGIGFFIFVFLVSTTRFGQWRGGAGPSLWVP